MNRQHVSRYLFILSLCLACFGYGVAVVRFRVFPYRWINEAELAARAFNDVYSGEADAYTRYVNRYVRRNEQPIAPPGVRSFDGSSFEEFVFVLGGPDQMRSETAPEGCLGCIVNRRGEVVHEWRYNRVLLDDLAATSATTAGARIFPVGAHVFDNGDLLVTLQGFPANPYGIGLLKIDCKSNVVWSLAKNAHHWFSIDEDGTIYTPAHRLIDAPYRLGETTAFLDSSTGKILEDLIQIVSPDGQIREEISVTQLLVDVGLLGLFRGESNAEGIDREGVAMRFNAGDPLHLNSVRLVRAGETQPGGLLTPGDLILSLRNINTVAVMDGKSRRIKWTSVGSFVQQHSPVPFNGGLLLLDNRGGGSATGGSRLARIDFESRFSQTVFPKNVALPEPFETWRAGHIALHPSGKRALIASTYQGVVWEIDLESGSVLWEFINLDPADPIRRKKVHQALYVENPQFEMNGIQRSP